VSDGLREHRVSDGMNAHVVDQTKTNPLYLLSHCAVTVVSTDARMELWQVQTASKQRLSLSNLKQKVVVDQVRGCVALRVSVFVTHE
jgi:hypothetical protein